MAKVLIIKLGYSETIDPGIGKVSSLGDVLRTTVILYPFASDQITWLVDEAAYPLLEGNPLIQRILTYDLTSVLQLQRERFDTVINLEKVPGICALADSISAWRRYGFRFDELHGVAEAYDGCEKVFTLSKGGDLKRTYQGSWQESLLQIVGARWEGQEYLLGYQPKTTEEFDVGLNWAVGPKWPNKAWPDGRWAELKELLSGRFTYSQQQGMDNLYAYMDWINSCRLLVTNDSLGLHIALALKKKVVVLYGPTNPNETYFYGRGEILYPTAELPCIPCLDLRCSRESRCMEFIAASSVMAAIERLTGAIP
ncbi:glycosyltransferase family 9 protein [Geobacter pelophilus]|jgi:heptosyltransferase-2|uniref:Glycosyltransferase family 9 protein n=1 Tax=Geoanaerobacter pelophilus TaxID=60036 RepID=A0AAW4LEV2_9BACT|nr:glycosyltransferase family 9 protein [Geoanaerobacter pelophilus]MBT0666534.1 glycosyltransferase family 9 protein [Geoanaerobacter pelophilus]